MDRCHKGIYRGGQQSPQQPGGHHENQATAQLQDNLQGERRGFGPGAMRPTFPKKPQAPVPRNPDKVEEQAMTKETYQLLQSMWQLGIT